MLDARLCRCVFGLACLPLQCACGARTVHTHIGATRAYAMQLRALQCALAQLRVLLLLLLLLRGHIRIKEVDVAPALEPILEEHPHALPRAPFHRHKRPLQRTRTSVAVALTRTRARRESPTPQLTVSFSFRRPLSVASLPPDPSNSVIISVSIGPGA